MNKHIFICTILPLDIALTWKMQSLMYIQGSLLKEHVIYMIYTFLSYDKSLAKLLISLTRQTLVS